MQNPESKSSNLFQNTWWILRLTFKEAPVIASTRIIGVINNNANTLLKAFVIGTLIDQMIFFIDKGANREQLIWSLVVFGAYYLFTGLAGVATNYGNNLMSFKMGYEIPHKLLYQKLNRLESADLENPEVQNLIHRFQENRGLMHEFGRHLFTLIGIGSGLLFAVVPLLSILPIPTAVIALASLPAFFTNKHILDRLWMLDKETTVLNRRGSSVVWLLQNPSTLKEIKLLNAYKYLRDYFQKYIDVYFGSRTKIYASWSAYDSLNTLLTGAAILFGIYSLIQLTLDGKTSVGQIAFFISALMSLGNYIDNFTANLASFSASGKRLSEMRKLLDWPEQSHQNKEKIPLLENPPTLSLKNVSFKYPQAEKYVIEDLNLEIQPGEKVAIVGENGAGKTTLVKLISNVYPSTSGEILVNNTNLTSIEPDSWFGNLGVLYQDYNTYDDLTAFENIALGRIDQELNYEQIQEAAKKADAYDFIMEFQDNFSQVLSERYEGGTRPSTGQWQKIAIARFFYRNAPILILDEPTASIDAVAEANIFDRIYQFIENKTVIIISHRFATVRNADRIIVFDHGRIVEEGSHEQLMQLNGKYAHAFNLQAKGYN